MDEMTDDERAALAQRVVAQRKARYGSASAAYRDAGLNAATWTRIESGQRVRDDRLIAAVRVLWPTSDGDWRRIDASPEPPDAERVGAWLADLQARVEALEAWRADQKEHAHDNDGPPTNPAAGSAAHTAVTTHGVGASRQSARSASAPPTPDPQRPTEP